MASSVEMADAIALALGLGGQTVRHHLRNLGERGLISYRGRGRNAAAMTSLDAARLVIAAAGSQLVKDSVATLERFGPLRRGWYRRALSPGEAGWDDADPDDGVGSDPPPPDADGGRDSSPATLESFLALRIDRLRRGYPERRDRDGPRPPRYSDRLAEAALELCGAGAPADLRAFAVVRWWAPGGRAEKAAFCKPGTPAVDHAADFLLHHSGLPMLTARYVSAEAFDSIARAVGDERSR